MGGILSVVRYLSIQIYQQLLGYPQKSFTFSTKSKAQLLLEYNDLNAVSAKYFYTQLLDELKSAVLSDELGRFRTLNSLLNYIIATKSSEDMQIYEQFALETVGKTNLICLACKTASENILEYLLSNQNVKLFLPSGSDRTDLSPEEEDDEFHGVFYYAIRSNVTRILEVLIEKWPNTYFNDTQKLDDVLSKAFNELLVRKVPLKKDMELYIKKKLVDIRFFHTEVLHPKEDPPDNLKDLLMDRIKFVLETIEFVIKYYSDDENELDEQFLHCAKYIAQNIHTLKSQLNFTYDRIPWEEMEFYLIVFIRFCIKTVRLGPWYFYLSEYSVVLNRQNMLSYLEKFSIRLECLKEELKTIDISSVSNKKITRKEIMEKEENKLFQDLYSDFTEMRDLYTLIKINKYTEIALSADPRNKEGQILITRALQVMGEHFNNSPFSPKLSDNTAESLLSVLPQNLADIITGIRNDLSHLEAFCLRSEIEENANTFFVDMQSDLEKIHVAIDDTLNRKRITVNLKIINIMTNLKDVDSEKKFAEQNHSSASLFGKVLENNQNLNLKDILQLEKLFLNFEIEFDKELNYSKKMFQRLHDFIDGRQPEIPQQSSETDLHKSYFCDTEALMEFLTHALAEAHSTLLLPTNEHFVTDGIIDADKFLHVMANIFHLKTLEISFTKNKLMLSRLKEKGTAIMEKCFPHFDNLLQKFPDEIEMTKFCNSESFESFKILVSNIEAAIENRFRSDKEMFQSILSMISDKKLKLKSVQEGLHSLSNVSRSRMKNMANEYKSLSFMRTDMGELQEIVKPLWQHMDLQSFMEEISLIAPNIFSREHVEYYSRNKSLMKAFIDFFHFLAYRLGNIKWIKEFKHMIHSHKKVKPYTFIKNVYTLKSDFARQLPLKISFLRTVLKNHNLESLSGEKLEACAKNTELQTLVEMLVLDILSVVEGLPKQLTHTKFYLDSYYPTVYGRNLRNHIAHDNALVDMLLGESFSNILVNAEKITEVEDILQEKLGKKVENDPAKSKISHDTDLLILKKQKQFFLSLALGIDESHIKDFISEGVDIYGRDINLCTALHLAAKSPNLEIIKFLIERNLDVNAKDKSNRTALHVAAKSGRENIVKYLIEQMKMQVDCKDIDEKTPLNLASIEGHEGVVRLLLKNNANSSIKDKSGCTPLHYAVLENQFDVVTALLENETNVDANQMFHGFTALHLAASRGHLTIVDSLLKKGANVNFKSDMGFSPLHYASKEGHFDVVKYLLEKKACVNTKTVQGLTPLHAAALSGDVAVIRLLLQRGAEVDATFIDGMTPLHISVAHGFFRASKLLLDAGASATFPLAGDATPLEIATRQGHCKLVKEFLHGADTDSKIQTLKTATYRGHLDIVELIFDSGVDIQQLLGSTALHLAAEQGHKDIAEFLLDRGADINSQDCNGSAALHWAAEQGHTDIAKFLLDRGADINAKDCNGDTALHVSSRKGRKEVVQLLIEMRAAILVKNNKDISALETIVWEGMASFLIKEEFIFDFSHAYKVNPFHLGALNGDISFINYCLQKGCPIDIKTETGSTALHLATTGCHVELINFLLEKGSDINAEDQNGYTAIQLAVNKNNKKILDLLIKKGANLSDADGKRLFYFAANQGHEDIVDFFLSRNSNAGAADSKNNLYPLHAAVTVGHVSVVKKILEKAKKGEINTMNGDFKTPLLLAIKNDRYEIAQLLLSKKADPDISSKDGTFPFLLAITKGNFKMVEILLKSDTDYLVKNADGETSIELAIKSRNLDIVELLLQKPGIQELTGQRDESLLHIAVSSGSLEIVKSLIDKKADINSRDASGNKPVHMAVKVKNGKQGNIDIVEYFLKLGVTVDERGENDWTLMHYAAAGNHSEICKFLSEKGADVNAVDIHGATPLHVAAEMDNSDAFLTLLEIGAFYDARNKNDETPLEVGKYWSSSIKITLLCASNLFSAVQNNDLFKLQEILRTGLVILKFNLANIKNKENMAPIHYAAREGYGKVVNILLRYRANPNLRTKNGWTSLHYAAKFSHFGITKDLLSNGAVYEAISDSGETAFHLSTDQDIVGILEFLNNIFQKVENKDRSILKDLKAIEDMDIAKTVMRAKNLQFRTLTAVAMVSGHPDANELREIFQKDVFIPLKMAEMFHKHGNVDDAFKLYKEILLKRMHLFGKNDPAFLEIQKEIALFLHHWRDYKESLSLAQKVYNTLKCILGDKNRETLIVKRIFAFNYQSLGRKQEALNIYEEVAEKQREVLGLNHRDTLATLTSLAEILSAEKKFERALKINEEIFETLAEYYETNYWTLRILTNIAMILRKQGKHSEALDVFKIINREKVKMFGWGHPETMDTTTEFAATLLLMGEEENSLTILKKNLNLQLNSLGPNHRDTLRTRSVIADILFQQRKICEALAIYTADLNETILQLGPDDPSIETAQERIDFINKYLKIPVF